jgi:hypothetical protein
MRRCITLANRNNNQTHTHIHNLWTTRRTKFRANKCACIQNAYIITYTPRASAYAQLPNLRTPRTHVRITHSDHSTTKHTFATLPYLPSCLQKYPHPLAVVSTAGRLCCWVMGERLLSCGVMGDI